ncbi:MAG: efflux transporter outer membrane subunit [Parachlamydiaceae bacterium]|nr:efflux transporter outer membrane subunit [Parachlamydiaceae bacterium]
MRVLHILALASLVGCMGPHYDAQFVDLPDSWRLEADEATTLCNMRWWEQFGDPVLDELIFVALGNNQDLKIAISRVCQYHDRLIITNSALYPSVNGNASFTRTKTSLAAPFAASSGGIPDGVTGFKRINNDYQVFLSLNWELDFWGRVRSASEAAYAELLAQVETRRAVVVTVVASTANAYITLRGLDSQLEVSKKTLKSRIQSLKLAQDRFELGETSQIEVRQAEAEVEIAAIRVIQLERDIPIQENLLSVILGQNPRDIIRGKAIEDFEYPMTIPAGIPSELLVRRPDIMRAEDTLIAANARVSEARALFFPKITLTGIYGSESAKLHNLFTSPAEMWQYGLSAVQTIFDAGKTLYQVEETKALRNQALFAYRQTILQAFREVNDGLVATRMNQKLVTEHKIQVKVLADYLHLATLRYNEGEIDYLNVLDAERSLFDSQLDLVQAQADTFTAVVNLYSALGGGWVCDADTVALSD